MKHAETAALAPFTLDARGASHIGHVREENQDDYLVETAPGLFIVADGVGGLNDGRFASHTVVKAMADMPASSNLTEFRAAFNARVASANQTLRTFTRQKGSALGTTLAALLIKGQDLICAWAGDSRIYRVRDGDITLLTEDHTEAAELIRQGVLSAEEARVWPRRNVITRAIGVEDEVDLEFRSGILQVRDIYLLCSDGLTTHLSDAEILDELHGRSLDEAVEGLIGATLRRGATDNVTVIVISIRSTATPSEDSEDFKKESIEKEGREKTIQLISRRTHHG